MQTGVSSSQSHYLLVLVALQLLDLFAHGRSGGARSNYFLPVDSDGALGKAAFPEDV